MKRLGCLGLLTVGFALTTAGLTLWHDLAFSFNGLWGFSGGPHPLFLLMLGIAMIPPALWEVFLLEQRGDQDSDA